MFIPYIHKTGYYQRKSKLVDFRDPVYFKISMTNMNACQQIFAEKNKHNSLIKSLKKKPTKNVLVHKCSTQPPVSSLAAISSSITRGIRYESPTTGVWGREGRVPALILTNQIDENKNHFQLLSASRRDKV